MNRLEALINRINFKRAVKVYVILSVLLIVLCASAIAFISRDKIQMAVDYNRISDDFKKEGVSDSLKSQLQKLAAGSNDIKNAIVLDKDNNIIFKINNNLVDNSAKLQFTPYEPRRNYLQDNINKGVMYKIVKEENIILDKDYIDKDRKIKDSIDGELFFEKDFANQDVYLLNYITQRNTGSKLFVIRDVNPIPYAESFLEVIGAIMGLIFLIYWIGLALWVYKDANKKHISPSLWGIIVLLTNLVGLIVYIMFKQNSRLCYECGVLQSKENIYCAKCGAKLNEACSKCGKMIKKGDMFCSRCGDKI